MTIEQIKSKLEYIAYNVTLESGDKLIVIEKDDVFDLLNELNVKCDLVDDKIEFMLNDILNKALLTDKIKGVKCSNTIAQYVIDYLKENS